MRFFLCLAFIFSISVLIYPSTQSAGDSLIAYWKFDEGAGNIAHDETGINNGTVNEASWVPGISNSALHFYVVEDYVTVPDADDLTFSDGNFTIEAYFKLDNIHEEGSPANWIMLKNGEYGLMLDSDGYLKFYIASGHGIETTYKVSTKNYWNAHKWYHVTGVYENGETWKIYIDKILDSTGNQPYYTMTTSCSLDIGNFLGCSCPHDQFEGTIDEVRISNVALEPSEFLLFEPPNLAIAYWNFDEGSGNIAYDSSGNEFHGHIYSPVWTDGICGKAMQFNGINSYVNIPDSDALSNFGEMTLEAWIKPFSFRPDPIV